jgi:hypothetical protein
MLLSPTLSRSFFINPRRDVGGGDQTHQSHLTTRPAHCQAGEFDISQLVAEALVCAADTAREFLRQRSNQTEAGSASSTQISRTWSRLP